MPPAMTLVDDAPSESYPVNPPTQRGNMQLDDDESSVVTASTDGRRLGGGERDAELSLHQTTIMLHCWKGFAAIFLITATAVASWSVFHALRRNQENEFYTQVSTRIGFHQ
jgi:hypothetical protein